MNPSLDPSRSGSDADPPPALELTDVGLARDGRKMLDAIDWTVRGDEHWVVIGANGSGKTTLLRVASLWLHPSRGRVKVLGDELGRTDVRRLRSRVGFVSAALADRLRVDLTAHQVVVSGRRGALEPWWHTYEDADFDRADQALKLLGVQHLAARLFGTLSSGERQRVQMARTLAADPEIVFLDEPTAGLDLGAREAFIARISATLSQPGAPPMVLVTHHVEEIPPGFTHALLLREGRAVAQGPISEVLTDANLSETFGLEVEVTTERSRWRAVARLEGDGLSL